MAGEGRRRQAKPGAQKKSNKRGYAAGTRSSGGAENGLGLKVRPTAAVQQRAALATCDARGGRRTIAADETRLHIPAGKEDGGGSIGVARLQA